MASIKTPKQASNRIRMLKKQISVLEKRKKAMTGKPKKKSKKKKKK